MAAASISGRTAVAILPLAPKAEGWFHTGLARAYPPRCIHRPEATGTPTKTWLRVRCAGTPKTPCDTTKMATTPIRGDGH